MTDDEREPFGSSGATPHRLVVPDPDPVEISRRPAVWDNPRARIRASSMTFGLPGRITVTVLLLLVLVWLCWANIFGVVMYLMVLPIALRDVWRPAQLRRPAPPAMPQPLPRTAPRWYYDPISGAPSADPATGTSTERPT
jgi:hypothetical protein